MADFSYAAMALLSFVVMLLLLSVIIEIRIKNGIFSNLTLAFAITAAFGLSDGLWGLASSRILLSSVAVFYVASMLVHTMATIAAYAWFKHTFNFLNVQMKLVLKFLSQIPLLVGLAIILSNPITGFVFSIDSDFTYSSGYLRIVLFVIQILYFLIAAFYSAYRAVMKSKMETDDGHYITMFVYNLIPVVCGCLQFFHSELPLYSVGYMISAILAFGSNLFRSVAGNLAKESNQYKDVSKEYYDALHALGQTYVSIHMFNMLTNTQYPISSNRFVDYYIDSKENMETQIRRVMEGVCDSEYRDLMVKFVDFSTLSDRMRGKNSLSQEFLGVNQGWCVSTFIRVESDEKGNLVKFLHAVMKIDDAKRREQRYAVELKKALETNNK